MAITKIADRNIQTFFYTEGFRSLVFTIPVWIAYLQERITIPQISMYLAIGFATQLILELPTGALADLIGRRKTVILGHIIDFVQYGLFAFAITFPQFAILSVLSGTAEALRSGSLEALVYDSLKQEKRESEFQSVMAKMGKWFQIGLMTGTLLGGFMASWWVALPYLASSFAVLCAGIYATRFVEPTIDSEKFGLRNYLRQIKWGAIEAFKSQKHRDMSLYYIAVGSITWLCATYFNDSMLITLGFGGEERGMIAAALRLVNVVVIAKLLTQEKLFDFRRTIIFFPIIMSMALLPGWWLQGYWGVPFVGMAMMASTARWILLGKYTNAVFSSKYRATAISALSMAISVIYILGVVLAGLVMGKYGDTRLIYSLLGLLSIMMVPYLGYRLLHVKTTN